MNCLIDKCEQQALGSHDYCYFHRKQQAGLIPIADRVYYLSDTDMQFIATRSNRDKVWALYGERYKPWVIQTATKFSMRFDVPVEDLVQVGMAFMWELGEKINLSKKPAQIVSFIKQRVRGVLLNCISEYMKYRSRMVCFSEFAGQVDFVAPPTEKSVGINLPKLLKKLEPLERQVFMLTMAAERPMSTRTAAAELGYKNQSSIARVQQSIRDKAKELLNDQTDM